MSSYQIIKLKNGEDLICNVLDNENGRLKVTTPLKMETVNRISKKGLTESLALTRWIQPYSDEAPYLSPAFFSLTSIFMSDIKRALGERLIPCTMVSIRFVN